MEISTCRVISAPHVAKGKRLGNAEMMRVRTVSCVMCNYGDVVVVARNQYDRTETNGEDEKDTLRLGAVDFHAFHFSRTAKSISLCLHAFRAAKSILQCSSTSSCGPK